MSELKITRRHLPHWTFEGSIYFVTFRAKRTVFDEMERRMVLDHIKEGDGKFYDCYAAMVMPDHVHLLIQPKHAYTLSRVMSGIKGVSAHKINAHRNATGTVWQHESFDRIVRDAKEFDKKLHYMYNNPLKKGIADDPSRYVGWFYNERICG
ncbi:MAG: transposase [Ignavibacteriales bacterium]|nr:transposase [Ignavibacteriales bacterium]